jgi:hypothetical protein
MQKTHHVPITESNQLMLFREIIAVYIENHAEDFNMLFRRSAEFLSVKTVGT